MFIIFDNEGLLKSISIVKKRVTVTYSGTLDDTKEMRESDFGEKQQ